MATWSGVELIRGREREVTETYQVSQRVGEASPCGQAPVAEAKIWFSVDSLPMTRSYAATTDEIGHFSFDLMSITDGLVPSVDADDEARELLLEQGIHFPVAKQSTLTLSVEYEVGDLKPVEIDLGDWFSEPARRIAVACNPPQPATACEQVVAELRDEHAATPHALAFLALLALTLSQEMQGTYKGARREGRRHGKGTATYAGGRRYEGQWKEGWREGRGSYKDPERSLEYVGMWKQGRRQGKGLQTTPDYRYEGQFEADQISGQGTMTYASGIKHRGQFKDGVPMGRGVRTRPNGLMLEAEYDDQTIVTGKNARVQWPSGVVWEGAWNDTLSGGHYSFTNPHRRSASELYVQAGRLLDEGEIDHAKLILRFVAKSNPGSEAARRSVDRLAVLRQSEKETAREQEQREAEQEALARREAEEREQAQEAAERRPSESTKSGCGFAASATSAWRPAKDSAGTASPAPGASAASGVRRFGSIPVPQIRLHFGGKRHAGQSCYHQIRYANRGKGRSLRPRSTDAAKHNR
ncbi:MAG: hypothetical protein AAF799_00695 [Myxococcota bacterium]